MTNKPVSCNFFKNLSGASATPLGSLFQCLITLLVRKFFLTISTRLIARSQSFHSTISGMCRKQWGRTSASFPPNQTSLKFSASPHRDSPFSFFPLLCTHSRTFKSFLYFNYIWFIKSVLHFPLFYNLAVACHPQLQSSTFH